MSSLPPTVVEINGFVPFAPFQQRDQVVQKVYDFRESFKCFQVFRYKDKQTGKIPLDQATDRAKELCTKAGLDGYTLPIFALDNEPYLDKKSEKMIKGPKRYAVTSYQSFWQHLVKTPKLDRNFYETILVDTPCHLHIDAEFNYEKNSKAESGQWYEDQMVQIVTEIMKELGLSEKLEWTILDASNSKKFSRHYIVKMSEGKAFKNNYHCGAFMRRVEKVVLERFGKDMATNPFYLWSEKETEFIYHPDKMNKTSFFDMTIYNRRRQFRTVGSVKGGEKDYENRALRKFGTSLDWKNPEMVLSALIQRVPAGYKIVSCLEWTGSEPISVGNSRQDRAIRMGASALIPFSSSMSSTTTTTTTSYSNISFSSQFLRDPDASQEEQEVQSSSKISFEKVRQSIEDEVGRQFSYALPLNNRGYNPKTHLLCLDSRSKQCVIAGREHSNNRIYFVASLDRLVFYQKCFHCSGSSSKAIGFSSKTTHLVQDYMKQQDGQFTSEVVAQKLIDYLNFYELLEVS